MFLPRFRTAALALVATLTLSACYDDGYGYGGLSVGYGSPGYYGSHYGYGYPYYGWYDGFYYPGTGYWIYDRWGHRHRWSDRHRRHWEGRRGHWRDRRDHWDGFHRDWRRGDDGRRDWRRDWRRDDDGRRRWRRDGDRRHREWRGDGERWRGGAMLMPNRSDRVRPQRATPRREGREPRRGRENRVQDK